MVKSFITAMIISILLITILNIVLINKSKKENKKIYWQHYFFGYLFMIYLIISIKEVVGFPCISEMQRVLRLNEPIFNPIINLIPFNDGLEISGILNIIFFMPFGFLLPTLWDRYKKIIPTIFSGLVFSIIIEIGQMFVNYRATDVNDLIMNTIGTVCGWIVFNVICKYFDKLKNKTEVKTRNYDIKIVKLEPYLYIVIATISTFIS